MSFIIIFDIMSERGMMKMFEDVKFKMLLLFIIIKLKQSMTAIGKSLLLGEII